MRGVQKIRTFLLESSWVSPRKRGESHTTERLGVMMWPWDIQRKFRVLMEVETPDWPIQKVLQEEVGFISWFLRMCMFLIGQGGQQRLAGVEGTGREAPRCGGGGMSLP